MTARIAPVPNAAAAAGADPHRSGLGGLVAALRAIMADPPAQAPVQGRIDAILRRIPEGDRRVVIWVRGTSDRSIKPEVRAAFERELAGEPVLEVDYEASWRFSQSVPDGAAVLRGVLAALARRRPRPQVLLAGESQGAWVISSVLRDRAMADTVTRAVLWGAPAAAPVDFADDHDARVREFNNPGDVVTIDLGREANAKLVGAIERFARHDVVGGVLPILGYAVTHPAALGALLRAQAWRVPGLAARFPSPHGYDFEAGVRFLRDGASERTPVSR
jgi:hypothetical protein